MVVPVLATASYGFISLAITFFNKAVLSVYQFKCPNIMTLGQMIVGTIIIQVGKNLDHVRMNAWMIRVYIKKCRCGRESKSSHRTV